MSESIKNPQDNNDWSLELPDNKSIDTKRFGEQALKTMELPSSIGEIASTAEKLKKGIKIVICGPPHSGKSVFIHSLMQALGEDRVFMLNAAPDGEGTWLMAHYSEKEAKKLRRKGEYTEAYVEDRAQKIKEWVSPITLIDIGGKITPEKTELVMGATHAIILAGSDDGRSRKGELDKNGKPVKDKEGHSALLAMEAWQEFCDRNKLDVIAKVYSDYYGLKDHVIQRENDIIKGSIHHLERGESAADREMIKSLAEDINDLVKWNWAYQGTFEPNLIDVRYFTDKLPRTTGERPLLKRSAIPEIYERAKRYEERPFWIDGSVNSWMATSISLALIEARSSDVRIRNIDGITKVKELPQSENPDPKWWNKPVYNGDLNGKPVYTVHNVANANAGIIMPPSTLDTLTVPAMPENATVIISTAGAVWLKASMAASYMNKVDTIAAYIPCEGATIVWSKDKSQLGKVIFTEENKKIRVVTPEK